MFFEWLAKLDRLGASVFRHPSEQKVLWKLEGQLESLLDEPFSPNYEELIAEARSRVEAGK